MAEELPVSTYIRRVVPADKAKRFDVLLGETIDASRTFDGHLGTDVLRPATEGGVYQIVFRFRDRASHDAWINSPARAVHVGRIDVLLGDEGVTPRTVDGWEGWFVTDDYAPPTPPRRWKMAVLTFVALYPLLLALLYLAGSFSKSWPIPLRLLLIVSVNVPLMTWVVMPALTKRLGPWLRR